MRRNDDKFPVLPFLAGVILTSCALLPAAVRDPDPHPCDGAELELGVEQSTGSEQTLRGQDHGVGYNETTGYIRIPITRDNLRCLQALAFGVEETPDDS